MLELYVGPSFGHPILQESGIVIRSQIVCKSNDVSRSWLFQRFVRDGLDMICRFLEYGILVVIPFFSLILGSQ